MKVIELMERLRFEVSSTTVPGEVRLVDMCEFNGNGACACWKFTKMIKPQLEEHLKNWKGKNGDYVPEERHQCEHIKAVARHLANLLVQATRKQFPDYTTRETT